MDVGAQAADLIWWLKDTPTGSIDDQGFLNISAPAASVILLPGKDDDESPTEGAQARFQDYQGNRWVVVPECRDSGPYAVKIGDKQNDLSGAYGAWIDSQSVMLMLVDRGHYGGLRTLGYAAVVEEIVKLPGGRIRP